MLPRSADFELQQLKRLSSCAVANAVESLQVRLRNEGFTDGSIHRFTTNMEPALGYAATIRIRSSSPPMDAPGYLQRTQWWDYVLSVPEPRFLVIQDMDPAPGTGALVGEVHAHILRALGCTAVATNGAVRDVAEVTRLGFSLFAARLSVSHAYSHVVEAGCAVEIGGLKVSPGNLIHGDCHGLVSIPDGRAAEVIAAAARLLAEENELLRLCRSSDFSVERLRDAIHAARSLSH